MEVVIDTPTSNAVINLVLDTLTRNKQALVFCNTKRGAEKTAEDISKQLKDISKPELSEGIRKALSRPTKQCERLARCILRGIAFHHSGRLPFDLRTGC